MQIQIKKWGNSQGVRLSKDILEHAGIRTDDVLEVTASKGVIMLENHFNIKPWKKERQNMAESLCSMVNSTGENLSEERSGNGISTPG